MTVAILLAITTPGHAQAMAGRRAGDDGNHGGRRPPDGHGQPDQHGDHGHHVFRGPFVYWNPYPAYVQPTPGYWYYCPSAEAYYPYVTYCLDSWVPVPTR